MRNLEGYYASDLTENKEITLFFDKRRSKDNTPIPLPLPEKKKDVLFYRKLYKFITSIASL